MIGFIKNNYNGYSGNDDPGRNLTNYIFMLKNQFN